MSDTAITFTIIAATVVRFVSNRVPVVLVALALASAIELGISSLPVLMSTIVASAAAFLTPVVTPVNLMVRGPATSGSTTAGSSDCRCCCCSFSLPPSSCRWSGLSEAHRDYRLSVAVRIVLIRSVLLVSLLFRIDQLRRSQMKLATLYRGARRWMSRLLMLSAVIVMTLLIGRAVQSQSGPPLELWHTFVPAEPGAAAIDRLDWDGYLAAENRTFAAIRADVTERLPEKDRRPDDRYFAGSPVYPGGFAQDWNRSYVLEPAEHPIGAVVLLHGLTDSPYSLRHVAKLYQARGYLAIGLRLPGHGTVPAALTSTTWEDWLAATRLAVREARRRVPSPAPLYLVGYSAGGAAAVKYALDALEDRTLPHPDRLVLISPMIGVSSFARFAGLAALPALLPSFAKAAWLSIVPEFNPFKYNSFPVNAARQAYRLTIAIQRQLDRITDSGRLGALAPILTFQSSVDFTVSARAVVTSLYTRLPSNGSELVLFDLNRNTKFGPLLRAVFAGTTERIVPPPPRDWRLTIITNTQDDPEMKERTTAAGETAERVRGLGIAYPRDVFSLSHVALPFPADDPLYGSQPNPVENFGVALGSLAAHGEVGVLIVSLDTLARLTWNPFFPYMLARIDETIGPAMVR